MILLDKWIKNHQNSSSFNTVDSLTVDEKELRYITRNTEVCLTKLKSKISICRNLALKYVT